MGFWLRFVPRPKLRDVNMKINVNGRGRSPNIEMPHSDANFSVRLEVLRDTSYARQRQR